MTEVSDICRQLRANADRLARELLPRGEYQARRTEWRVSGSNSPTGGAISVYVGPGPKQGIVGFWDSDEGGDILDLIKVITGSSTVGAINWAREWLGGRSTNTPVDTQDRGNDSRGSAEDSAASRIRIAQQLWNASGDIVGAGRAYLEARGINPSVADPDQIRFHPSLRHPDEGTFPALVARVSDRHAQLCGVWRIYVKIDGSGKAPVSAPRLGLGVVSGGAVHLGGASKTIGVAEGIETALAARELSGLPVWAALSASGMRKFVPPDGVEKVVIYADHDLPRHRNDKVVFSAGVSAAEALRDRMDSSGVKSNISLPPAGKDWLDVLVDTKRKVQ